MWWISCSTPCMRIPLTHFILILILSLPLLSPSPLADCVEKNYIMPCSLRGSAEVIFNNFPALIKVLDYGVSISISGITVGEQDE